MVSVWIATFNPQRKYIQIAVKHFHISVFFIHFFNPAYYAMNVSHFTKHNYQNKTNNWCKKLFHQRRN